MNHPVKFHFKLLFLLIGLAFLACDEETISIPEPPAPSGRVLLIEEFTGVNCVPCYAASNLIEEILANTNGAVVVYGIHGLDRKGPIDGTSYNFTNEDAIELEKFFDFAGKPAAAFNRVALPNGDDADSGINDWQGYVDAELEKSQVAEIFVTPIYNEETRQLELNVGVIPIENISGEVNLHLVITESKLIDSQESPEGVKFDFEHNHVMKASLTGLAGDFLAENLEEGVNYSKTYSYSLPQEVNSEWVSDHMEVTVFITSKDRRGEVQHAVQIKLEE